MMFGGPLSFNFPLEINPSFYNVIVSVVLKSQVVYSNFARLSNAYLISKDLLNVLECQVERFTIHLSVCHSWDRELYNAVQNKLFFRNSQ